MLWAPILRIEVVKVAWPLPSSVPVPMLLAPSRNVTVPVGAPEPGATAETVAVKVTAWPKAEGLLSEVTVVEVLAWLTVCVGNDPVLGLKLASPAYCAVMLCAPTLRVEVAKVACPLPSNVPVPMLLAPSRNVTAPVGVPEPGATAETVAVKVTAWPKAEGLLSEVTVVEVLAWLTVCVGNDPVLR